MSYKIIAIPQFEKELKRLSKKYPSIKNDLSKVANDLLIDPQQGTPIGNHCYKI
jgi:mRNA-degrading endonuclease RelE of RelBE toxin-antitoxin system